MLQQALDIIGPTLRQGGGIAALTFVGFVVSWHNIVSNVPFVLVFLAVVPRLAATATSYFFTRPSFDARLAISRRWAALPISSRSKNPARWAALRFRRLSSMGLAITAVSLVVAGAGYALARATRLCGALG